jgi:hypothetical protein
MKTLLTFFLIILVSFHTFGQRKSKVDPNDAKIDSLTKATIVLTRQADSISAELQKYLEVYTVIKEKVIHYNFDPKKTSFLIDSLKASRDAEFSKLAPVAQPALPADSILFLIKENKNLKTTLDSMKIAGMKISTALTKEEIAKATAISSLKQLKELVDTKIITESEFIALKKKYLEKL